MFGSTHYQWLGEAPDMVQGPLVQGMLTNAINNYCINIQGNWELCGSCHTGMDHSNAGRRNEPDRHVARVAWQSCHIPTYAKWETETHRGWEIHHDGSSAHGSNTTPGHPHSERATNLTPLLKFWNRLSVNALLS